MKLIITALTTAAKVLALGLGTAAVTSFAIATIHGPVSGSGIIALDGYPHAVVICGEATTINAGHEADSQVAELLALAAELCPAQ